MRVLFAVFVLCLAALFVTLLAVRRHIRKQHARPGDPAPLPGTQHHE